MGRKGKAEVEVKEGRKGHEGRKEGTEVEGGEKRKGEQAGEEMKEGRALRRMEEKKGRRS